MEIVLISKTSLYFQPRKKSGFPDLIHKMAGEERIELSITVLETAVIPFNYSPKNSTIILLKDTRNVNKNCAVTI